MPKKVNESRIDRMPLNDLRQELQKKDALIEELQLSRNEREIALQEKVELARKEASVMESKISRLEEQLKEARESGGADRTLIAENEQTRLQIRSLRKEIELKSEQLVVLEGEKEQFRREAVRTAKTLEHVEGLFAAEQQKSSRLESELNLISKRINASFEMEELSRYLTGAINDFNKAVNTENPAANYVISEVEMEMKANISKAENNRMRMVAPEISANSPEALSTIRFSISAVPKDIGTD